MRDRTLQSKIAIAIEGEISSLLRRSELIKGASPRFQARKDILDATFVDPEGTRKQSAPRPTRMLRKLFREPNGFDCFLCFTRDGHLVFPYTATELIICSTTFLWSTNISTQPPAMELRFKTLKLAHSGTGRRFLWEKCFAQYSFFRKAQ